MSNRKNWKMSESIIILLMINFAFSSCYIETKTIPSAIFPYLRLFLEVMVIGSWIAQTIYASLNKKNEFLYFLFCLFLTPYLINYVANLEVKSVSLIAERAGRCFDVLFIKPWVFVYEKTYLILGVSKISTFSFVCVFLVLIYVVNYLLNEKK